MYQDFSVMGGQLALFRYLFKSYRSFKASTFVDSEGPAVDESHNHGLPNNLRALTGIELTSREDQALPAFEQRRFGKPPWNTSTLYSKRISRDTISNYL